LLADVALRVVGMGGEADKLKAGMNHAAEAAVAEAKPVFKAALARMTVADAKAILTGGDDAGTQYFRSATSAQLTGKFKPIVARETGKLQLASLYDQYAGKAADLGLITAQDAKLNDYVTAKALAPIARLRIWAASPTAASDVQATNWSGRTSMDAAL
jgi:hypothetical protein